MNTWPPTRMRIRSVVPPEPASGGQLVRAILRRTSMSQANSRDANFPQPRQKPIGRATTMNTKLARKLIQYTSLLLLLSTVNSQLSTIFAQGTAFNYQGRLFVDRDRGDGGNHEGGLNLNGGNPVNGTNFAMLFALFDDPTNGNVLGTQEIVGVSVNEGFYTVQLDFGTNFPGADRWLEISVQEKNGGAFVMLSPRQKLA